MLRKHRSWTEEGKAELEVYRSSVPPPRIIQCEILRQGLGSETQDLDFSSREKD